MNPKHLALCCAAAFLLTALATSASREAVVTGSTVETAGWRTVKRQIRKLIRIRRPIRLDSPRSRTYGRG